MYKRLRRVLLSLFNPPSFKSKPNWWLITLIMKLSIRPGVSLWNGQKCKNVIQASSIQAVLSVLLWKDAASLPTALMSYVPRGLWQKKFVGAYFFFPCRHHLVGITITSHWLMAHLKEIYRGVSWPSERTLCSLMALWLAPQVSPSGSCAVRRMFKVGVCNVRLIEKCNRPPQWPCFIPECDIVWVVGVHIQFF